MENNDLHRKVKIEQQKLYKKNGMYSGAPEGKQFVFR